MNNFQTFQPFFNKCAKTPLPIMGNVRVRNFTATISDLETTVMFEAPGLADGYYDLRINEPFNHRPLDDEYPEFSQGTEITQFTIKAALILKYAACTDNDLIRPVMSSICINHTEIVATDHSLLRHQPHGLIISTDPHFEILFQPVAPLLARCRCNPDEMVSVTVLNSENENGHFSNVRFTFSNCLITVRAIEGEFPEYESIIPEWTKLKLQYFSLTLPEIQEMVKTSKAFSTPLMKVSPSGLHIENHDLGLSKSWPAPLACKPPKRKPDGLLMPMMLIENGEDTNQDDYLGLSPVELAKFTPLFKGNITIGHYDPSRPMAIWLESGSIETAKQRALVPKSVKKSLPPAGKKAGTHGEISLVKYSPKAVALFGDTKPIKDQLRAIGGRFNPNLQHNSRRMAGWVFPRKREAQLKQLLAS